MQLKENSYAFNYESHHYDGGGSEARYQDSMGCSVATVVPDNDALSALPRDQLINELLKEKQLNDTLLKTVYQGYTPTKLLNIDTTAASAAYEKAPARDTPTGCATAATYHTRLTPKRVGQADDSVTVNSNISLFNPDYHNFSVHTKASGTPCQLGTQNSFAIQSRQELAIAQANELQKELDTRFEAKRLSQISSTSPIESFGAPNPYESENVF